MKPLVVPIRRIVKLHFKPSQVDSFLAKFDTLKDTITNFEGCQTLDLLQDIEQENIFFTHSEWTSKEDLENYRKSDFFKQFWKTIKMQFQEPAQAWSTVRLVSSTKKVQSAAHTHSVQFGNANELLNTFLNKSTYTHTFVLVDENTKRDCLPILIDTLKAHNTQVIEIESGEINKNLLSCKHIWQTLIEQKANRKSLLINLGGGVIGDMGGFCAASYKRGIDFLQIPTTLLSQVDASVGGKLGIDFMGLKNVIGQFKNPKTVIIDTQFLQTLPYQEIRSGFAEMLKHAIINSKTEWQNLGTINLESVDYTDLLTLIKASVSIKEAIVEADPFEKNVRKKLNLGHTIGHAVETHFLNNNIPILHGEAVAYGLKAEAHIAFERQLLSADAFDDICKTIDKTYPKIRVDKTAFEAVVAYCYNDKKNENKEINASLINEIGEVIINQSITEAEITSALAFLNNQ